MSWLIAGPGSMGQGSECKVASFSSFFYVSYLLKINFVLTHILTL